MARVSDDIVITVGGDIGPLTDAVTKADRVLGRLKDSTKKADQQFRAMVGTGTVMQARIEGLAGATDRLSKSAEASARSFGQFEKAQAQVDRLRASFDPLFAASKRYETAVEELDRALEMGVLTQAQYNKLVQDSAKHYLSAAGQTGKMGTEMSKAGKSANALQYQVQNASYQVGDFFVQIASGTAASRALAQQLPQLLGGFGMIGAVAGAVAAIGGALIPVFIGNKEAAKDFEDQLRDLNSAIDTFSRSSKAHKSSIMEIAPKYGHATMEARKFLEVIRDTDAQSALSQAKQMADELATSFGGFSSVLTNHSGSMSQWQQALMNIQRDFKISADEAGRFARALVEISRAETPKDYAAALDDMLDVMGEITIEGDEQRRRFEEIRKQVANVGEQMAQIVGVTDDATGATEDWAAAMGGVKSEISGIASLLAGLGGGVISNAAKMVELQARQAGKSKAEAVRERKAFEIGVEYDAKDVEAKNWADRVANNVQRGLAMAQLEIESRGLDIDAKLSALDEAERKAGRTGRSKKGGGERDREGKEIERRLERMQNDFASEQELAALQNEERHQTLLDARSRELITEEQFQEMKLKSQEEYLQKMKDLDRLALHEKLAAWSGGLGDLASLMNSGNKKMFQIGKIAAIAQAVVDGWSAATSAWEKGMEIGGPPTAAAFSAMSLARTGAMLASIKSTQFGGGGGGGAGGGAAAPSVPSESPNKVANYQISGDVLGKQSTADLFKSINEGIKDGYTIIDVEWV